MSELLHAAGPCVTIIVTMQCPTCQKNLADTQLNDCLICPDGHGVLIPSSHLAKKSVDSAPHVDPQAIITETTTAKRDHDITCPRCNSPMQRVNYSSTGIIIDSCMKCHSRWLDSGEFTKIISYKPQLNKRDAAFIEQLEETMATSRELQSSDVNPAYRLTHRSGFSSSWAFVFAVSRAVMKGLLHSKYTRIATVLILVVALILYAYVIKEFQN